MESQHGRMVSLPLPLRLINDMDAIPIIISAERYQIQATPTDSWGTNLQKIVFPFVIGTTPIFQIGNQKREHEQLFNFPLYGMNLWSNHHPKRFRDLEN